MSNIENLLNSTLELLTNYTLLNMTMTTETLTITNEQSTTMTSDQLSNITTEFMTTDPPFTMTTDPPFTMTTDPPFTMTTEPSLTMTTFPTTTSTLATTTTIITTILIACTRPPPVSNAIFTFSGYDVIYTCNSGFTMTGGSRLDCDVTNGKWRNNPPSCSPLDLRPRLENTINIPETKEAIKSTDIQLIVGVLGGLLALIAFIGLLLFIAHLCGCGTPICGGSYRQDYDACWHNERRRRRISNSDVRIYHSNVEHTFYDSGNVLVDLESGRYVLPQKGLLSNSITKEDFPEQNSNGGMTNFHHIDSQTRNNTMDFPHNKRKGSIDVSAHNEHEDSPYSNNKLHRAQRKVQAVNSWMPHSKPIRNINTSTK